MRLLDEIASVSRGPQKCKVGVWLDSLKPDYQMEVLEVLASEFKTNTIWKVLRDKHQPFMSASVFGRHREGRCCCVAS